MKNNRCKKGFTLIELLVVVLIIGILAAIALPQYQKAVEKSRAAELITFIGNAQKAVDRYLLTNGGFPTETNFLDLIREGVLDVDLTTGMTCADDAGMLYCYNKYFSYHIECTRTFCQIEAHRTKTPWTIGVSNSTGDRSALHLHSSLKTTDGKTWNLYTASYDNIGLVNCQAIAHFGANNPTCRIEQ